MLYRSNRLVVLPDEENDEVLPSTANTTRTKVMPDIWIQNTFKLTIAVKALKKTSKYRKADDPGNSYPQRYSALNRFPDFKNLFMLAQPKVSIDAVYKSFNT